MKGTTYKRCGCKDPKTRRRLEKRCPDLEKRRHGHWVLSVRIDTTKQADWLLKRGGYETQTSAQNALARIDELIRLAGADTGMRGRIGDLIVERSRHGGELPTAEDVRRRLGAGIDLESDAMTLAMWLDIWLAGKRKLKESTRRGYRKIVDQWLAPHLGQIPLDKLQPEHIDGLLETVAEYNEEIEQAREEGRAPNLPGDKRAVKKVTGPSTQRRILETLRNALNTAIKRRKIDFNPITAVEFPEGTGSGARVWGPEQVATFLEATRLHRFGLLYRLVLLCGLRRGEVCGLRWEDLEKVDGRWYLTVSQTVLQVHGTVYFDTPKTRAGARRVSIDSGTADQLQTRRKLQRRERLAACPAWKEHGLIFTYEDGRPLSPDWVSTVFKAQSREAGLPVIRLHDGRHTAATLGLEAGLPIKVVSDRLGHSTTRITEDLYTHVRVAVADDAADKVVELLPTMKTDTETGT